MRYSTEPKYSNFKKILNVLNATSDDEYLPWFFTKNWIEVYDQSERNNNVNNEIRILTISIGVM